MLPAEMFVLALCVFQPKRGPLIVLLFAAASTLSAFLLALGMGTLTESAESLSQKLMGSQGPQVLAMLRDSGPVSMVFFSVFPDSPRSAIALFALSGVSPQSIGTMVFIGKLTLYTVLLLLIHHLPSRVGRWPARAFSTSSLAVSSRARSWRSSGPPSKAGSAAWP